MQDKRAVVPLQPSAFDVWLRGTIEEATAALVLPHVDDYDAGPDGAPPVAPKAPVQPDLLCAPGADGRRMLSSLKGPCDDLEPVAVRRRSACWHHQRFLSTHGGR